MKKGVFIIGALIIIILSLSTIINESKKEIVAPTPFSVKDETNKVSDTTIEGIETNASPYKVYVWGNNDFGQLGLTSMPKDTPEPFSVPTEVVTIASGETHTAYLSPKGDVYTWGANELHELGRPETEVYNLPNKVKGLPKISSLATTYRHVLALANNGTVYAWGSNYTGQIGDGTNENARSPKKVQGLPSSIVEVATGYKFSLARTNDGSVYAWGALCAPYNDRVAQNFAANLKQSASGYYDPIVAPRVKATLEEDCKNENVVGILSRVPKKISVTDIVQMSAGYGHALFLKNDGTVWSFGCNLYGQLGNRGTTNAPTNSLILQVPDLENVKMVAAGFRHSLALTNDGSVYMWGGTAKDMGDDARILKNKEIVKITSLKNIKAVYAGKDYSLALSNDGILYGWGNNTNQILSKSDKKIISAPVALNLPGSLQAIGTGNNFLVAVTKQ